ncbi:hypothetical protein HYPSUDRAFT_132193, partial [Hypholoma sublateritium FD-334 SS-4]
TVETLITHTFPWMARAMGYEGLWVSHQCIIRLFPRQSSAHLHWCLKPMGFSFRGVWGMGYCGLMGYGLQIPAHRLGGSIFLWVMRGYGLSEVWVMRVSTVIAFSCDAPR